MSFFIFPAEFCRCAACDIFEDVIEILNVVIAAASGNFLNIHIVKQQQFLALPHALAYHKIVDGIARNLFNCLLRFPSLVKKRAARSRITIFSV